MNARSLAAAWFITLALTVSGIFWTPLAKDDPNALTPSPAGTTVCVALDTAWSCK